MGPCARAQLRARQGRRGINYSTVKQPEGAGPHCRGAMRPGCASRFAPKKVEGAGRTGCAPAPRGLACMLHKEMRTRAYRFSGTAPAFPAQWLYGLLRARPVTGFLATVIKRITRSIRLDRCATT